MSEPHKISNYALHLSTYPPRECGIATFTQDLISTMNKSFNPALKSRVVALNEEPATARNYDSLVVDKVPAQSLEQYVSLAKRINKQDKVKIINIQHEFGIFGGVWGDYLIPFMQVAEKPVVITLHSVLPKPGAHLKKTVQLMSAYAHSLVVMNRDSGAILKTDYEIPKSKIRYIPHGIPNTPFESSRNAKAILALEGKIVFSTFGLISPNKGIEYAIRSLPRVVKSYPNVRYMIVGQTHPVVRRERGEAYRNKLRREVETLGLGKYVKFYNKYLSPDELTLFLKATDVYIAPNIDRAQSVSGSLSYALGVGRPVISAATSYAGHIITKETGVLVRPRNATDIGKAAIALIKDPKRMREMSANAYETTRHMTWPNVARAYYRLYEKAGKIGEAERKLPKIKLDHMKRLTNNFGIVHFAKYSTPTTRYGYSLDDNARALIVTAARYKENPEKEVEGLMRTYLAFLKFNQRADGTFANIVSSAKKRDNTRDEDVQGRAFWAAITISADQSIPKDIRKQTANMLKKSIKLIPALNSPRAIAFAMTGLYNHLKVHTNARFKTILIKLADKLIAYHKATATKEWDWFENELTYSNSKLPEALYCAYDIAKKKVYLTIAERSLNFLSRITFTKKQYIPIGQNGWYFRYKERAYFDQQPEDAATMAQTKIVAYKITKNAAHLHDAVKAFEWFLGKNHLNQVVYDEATGGCQDGVGENRINLNQGAESTISYLLARLAFEDPVIRSAL